MPVPDGTMNAPETSAADFASLMRPVNPAEVAGGSRLATEPNRPFFLRHHPVSWSVASTGLKEPTWLPELVKSIMQPGVGLMRTLTAGETKEEVYRRALDNGRRQGWAYLAHTLVLPDDCVPAGVPAGSYLRAVACRDPKSGIEGERFLEVWDIPRPPIPGRAQGYTFDHASYNRFRLWLVTSGLIAPPAGEIVDELIASRRGRISRHASLPLPDAVRTIRLAAVEADVEKHTKATRPARSKRKAAE